MSTQTTTNTQTPGPLTVRGSDLMGGDSPDKPAQPVAQVAGPNRSDRLAEKHANRRLLAAGFNAFDRAGRELGVDAAELAEGLDLVALIRAARNLRATYDQDETGTWGPEQPLWDALRKALAPLSTLTAEPGAKRPKRAG